MLMISLALHGVVLMLPISSDLGQSKSAKQYKSVKITQLPTNRRSAKPSSQSLSKPNPQPSSKPSPSTRLNPPTRSESSWEPSPQPSESTRFDSPARPESSSKPNPQARTQRSQSTRSKPKQPLANPIISQSKPKPNSQPEASVPASDQSESSKSNSSLLAPSNVATDTNTGTGTTTNAEQSNVKDPLQDFLSNFPFPKDVSAGSLGVLPQGTDASARNIKQPLGQVLKYYGKELPNRQYSPLASPLTDDADLKIYQVSKGDVSQYLHLISKGEDTVIFLSAQQLARKDLANLEIETAEEREFKATLRQTIAMTSTKELTSDIKSKLGDGKYSDFGIFPGKTPAQLGSEFKSALSGKGFDVGNDPINLGADGLIYSVKKNDFVGHIQLIPTQDGSGTAIIGLDKFQF
jgi:hypothetical protein